MPSDGVVAPEVREVESLAHDDVLGLSSVWTARSGLPPRDGDPLQERTSTCDKARHILDALQPSLLRGRTAAMSNPAFAFDHIHIISQNPKASANWYVQMFGADIVADTVARGAPQIFQIPPDLVVKSQAIDIAEVILSRIRRPNAVHTLCRNKTSRFEQLSTSEAHWSTTKSDGM
jgi:hypothetical protein